MESRTGRTVSAAFRQPEARRPLIGLVAGVLGSGLGIVLPWVSGLLSINGYETDFGKVVLAAFVLGAGCLASVYFVNSRRGLGVVMAVIGLVPLAIGLYVGINIERAIGDNPFADAFLSTGFGVWVTVIAGAVWVAAGALLARNAAPS